jgi:hypothetical protein
MNTFGLLQVYLSPNNTSVLKGVPIALRDVVLSYYKSYGKKVKLRYRGPRAHRTFRSPITRSNSCLMQDATTFAVYLV